MNVTTRLFATVMFCLAAAGCSAAPEEEEELGSEEGELRGALEAGAKVITLTRLNFRTGPSRSAQVMRILSAGSRLTLVDGEPENQFYRVKAENGQAGYVHGAYIEEVGGGTSNPGGGGQVGSFPTSGDIFRSRGTGYYPANNSMEGGFLDRRGARLRTLQQYLNGQAEYVSVAMDTNAFAYGTRLRIKEFEAKYGRRIEFRVVDTGGAFRGRGRSRIDICTASRSASLDPTVNSMLTIAVDR